jgi:hypothetical protein
LGFVDWTDNEMLTTRADDARMPKPCSFAQEANDLDKISVMSGHSCGPAGVARSVHSGMIIVAPTELAARISDVHTDSKLAGAAA